MRKTKPMIFKNRSFGDKIRYLRAYKMYNGKFTVEFLNHGESEWKVGILFPIFNSRRSVEKWLKERCDIVKD